MTTLSSIPTLLIRDALQYIPTPDIFKNLDNEYIFWACPFKIPIGGTIATGTGFKPLNSNLTDYSQKELVLDGRGSILAVWEDSYTIEYSSGSSAYHYRDNAAKKKWKVGTSYKGVIVAENTVVGFAPFVGDSRFQSEFINKQATIRFYNIPANKTLMDNLNNDYFRLWVLPQFNMPKMGANGEIHDKKYNPNPYRDESRTLFYAESYTLQRQPDRTIAYIDITFISINDKMNKSALAINSYIQFGGAGEPYAFPIINPINNDVELDRDRRRPNPITHFQVQYMGLTLMGPVGFYGRPVYDQDLNVSSVYLNHMNIYPSGHIFPHIYQKPIHNPVNLKQYPETILCWPIGLSMELIETARSSEKIAALENPFIPTDNQGYISTDYGETLKTNENELEYYNPSFLATSTTTSGGWKTDNTSIRYAWQTNFLPGEAKGMNRVENNKKLQWNCEGNNYFLYQYKGQTYHKLWGYNGASTPKEYWFDFGQVPNSVVGSTNKVIEKGLATWNMLSLMLAKTQLELPLDIESLTKIDAVSFPILGSLFRDLTFGFAGDGWSFISQIKRPQYPFFNCLLPLKLYKIYSSLWVQRLGYRNGTTHGVSDGTLPYQLFMEGAKDGVGLLTGYDTMTMALNGSLTNIITTNYIVDGSPQHADRITIPTSDLGQNIKSIATEFNSGYYGSKNIVVPILNEKSRPDYPTASLSLNNPYHTAKGNIVGYYIDFYELLASTKASYQLKFFNLSKFPANKWNVMALKDEYCVWMANYESVGNITDTLRKMRQYGVISDPTFNIADKFNYPQRLQNVQPSSGDTYSHVWFYESLSLTMFNVAKTFYPTTSLKYAIMPQVLLNNLTNFTETVGLSQQAFASPEVGYQLEYIELDEVDIRYLLSPIKIAVNSTIKNSSSEFSSLFERDVHERHTKISIHKDKDYTSTVRCFYGYSKVYDTKTGQFAQWGTATIPTLDEIRDFRHTDPIELTCEQTLSLDNSTGQTRIKLTLKLLEPDKWRCVSGWISATAEGLDYQADLGLTNYTYSISASATLKWQQGKAIYKKL